MGVHQVTLLGFSTVKRSAAAVTVAKPEAADPQTSSVWH